MKNCLKKIEREHRLENAIELTTTTACVEERER
jgi:hypothetical protein